MAHQLFSPARLGQLTLTNHLVMAPMTRNRATTDHLPTDSMATYYAQRATAGLIISEGVAPSLNGEGYARIPGIGSPEQVERWKPVTAAVHERGGKIFVQLMHTGRISHPLNMREGAQIVAPSAVAAAGDIYTDQQGMQPHPTPAEMTTDELKQTVAEFVTAARNAIEAGFDGVELHAANGYLLEQFIAPNTNQRTDAYGGSIENRSRFVLDVVDAVGAAIGFERVGIRLSPYGVFNDIHPYAETDATYHYLADALNRAGVVYIHLVDHTSMGAPAVPVSIVDAIRERFAGTLILSGGYDAERAEAALQAGKADLVAFGRPFISNPDLVERLQTGAELTPPDYMTFYTPGETGYTDYPALPATQQA